jgi:hypothetical protein
LGGQNGDLRNRNLGRKQSRQDEVLVLVGDVERAVIDPAVKDVSVDGRAPRVWKAKGRFRRQKSCCIYFIQLNDAGTRLHTG